MAAIDKLYLSNYYQFSDLRSWALIYYPKLIVYMRDISFSYKEFVENRNEWTKAHKRTIEKELKKLGKFKDKDEAIHNLMEYYRNSPLNYNCPLSQAIEEVNYILEESKKEDFEDDFTFFAMSTPLEIDRRLKWICPLSFIRKYLEKQCGYKTKWYHKLFWKGKKLFL